MYDSQLARLLVLQVAEVYKRALEKGKRDNAHVLIKYMVSVAGPAAQHCAPPPGTSLLQALTVDG